MAKSAFFVYCCYAFAAGVWLAVSPLMHSHDTNIGPFDAYYGQKIVFDGLIINDPAVNEQGNQAHFSIVPDGFHAAVRATVSSQNNYRYGDKVFVIGVLRKPQTTGTFDHAAILREKGIYAEMSYPRIFVMDTRKVGLGIFAGQSGFAEIAGDIGVKLKRLMVSVYQKVLNKQQLGLLVALVTGDKSYLGNSLTTAFNAIGVAHVIAVSGYKLTLVIIMLEALGPYIGRRKLFVFSLVFIFVYLAIAGFAPAVLRAAIMSLVFSGARILGRKYSVLPSLCLTAVVLLLIQPSIITGDIGFILSFAGILGILLFGKPLAGVAQRLGIPHLYGAREIFVSTIAAQLATFPLIMYYFGQFSWISPFTNVLFIPLLAPFIIAGYLALLPALGAVFLYVLAAGLNFILITTEFLAGLNFTHSEKYISAQALAWFYVAEFLLLLIIRLKLLTRIRKILVLKKGSASGNMIK